MRTVIVAFLLVLLAAGEAGAAGKVSGDTELDDGADAITTEIWVTDNGAVAEPAATGTALSRSPRVFRYVYEPFAIWSTDGGGPFCDNDGAPGWKYRVTTVGATGTIVGTPLYLCVPFPDPDDQSTPPAPPSLPEPPTVAEIWHAVATSALPKPQIGVSPHTDGVTGLETWMWVTGEPTDSVPVAAAIGAWSVTGTATRSGYAFDFGDGAASRSTNLTGGSEAEPAARHTYETKGPYVLTVSSTWSATFALTGPNVTTALPVDAGTATVATARDYRVVEIRSVLVE